MPWSEDFMALNWGHALHISAYSLGAWGGDFTELSTTRIKSIVIKCIKFCHKRTANKTSG